MNKLPGKKSSSYETFVRTTVSSLEERVCDLEAQVAALILELDKQTVKSVKNVNKKLRRL